MSTSDFKKLSKELSGKSGFAGSFLLFLILLLICVSLVWAQKTELDNVTRGPGKVVSSMQNQLVQASEGGVLKASFVNEGERVSFKQLLFEIDPIDAKTAYDQAQQMLISLKIQEVRLSSEINDIEPKFSGELVDLAPSVVKAEKALYIARKANLKAQLSVLAEQYNQRTRQVAEVDVAVKTARETLELVKKQIEIIEPLVDAGLSPETELLAIKRQAADFKGSEQSALASLERVRSSIAEIEEQIESTKQSYSTESQSQLSRIISEIAEVESRVPVLKDRVERTSIRSPVDGIINRLNFRTIGGFVKPGDVLVELVPFGDKLIVESRIDPKDIAYIRPDQDVRISLTAYDASRYGTIDGKVIKVSADATQDSNTGLSFYKVDVSLDSNLYEDDNSEVEVFPGMVASIDVLAGKRTVLEYIWQPMAKVKERAFTD
jgi:adhesin transport system membrane fusion protein